MSTVAVVTALDLEYQAIRKCLDELRLRSHPAGTIFEVGRLRGTDQQIALTVTGEGNVSAAVLAERAIAAFRPQALLCVGVAGGLKDDVELGDVVVATKVYALHGGRDHGDGFLARPKAWPAAHQLEQLARYAARSGDWTELLTAGLLLRPPTVHFKPVVSGEVILSSPGTSLSARLRSIYEDAVAVDMESAGVAQAAHLNRSLPVLSVRGISDRTDPAKSLADAAGWQHLAAGNAAAFTASICALMPADQVLSGQSGRGRPGRARCSLASGDRLRSARPG